MMNSKFMQFVKKNLLSLLCGLVAILAIVATYWPVGKMFSDLQDASDKRGAVYSELQGILTKSRQLPLTDPNKTQQDDLKIFPNAKMIALGTKVTDDVHNQSMDMLARIVDLNKAPHAPLVPYVLPDPPTDQLRSRFGDLYKLVLSMDPAKTQDTDQNLKAAGLLNLRNDVLHGGIPPTEVEITAAKDALKTNVYDPQVYMVNGQAVNQEDVTRKYTEAAAQLPDQMRYDVAKKNKIYVASDVFTENPLVTGQQLPNPVDIWYAQMTLWIQQDVAQALAEANKNSQNILDAPVKHLLKLTIPSSGSSGAGGVGIYTTSTPTSGGAGPAVPAAPVDGSDVLPVPKILTVSPTGRVSNPLYDVVQFTLVINVDSSQIPAVLASLSRDQLMDVMFMTVTSVDSDDQQRQGFFYGSAPVVQLTLSCETLFMRQWTAPLMPSVVKGQVGVAIPGAPVAPPQQ
jgi:hypothetical protein